MALDGKMEYKLRLRSRKQHHRSNGGLAIFTSINDKEIQSSFKGILTFRDSRSFANCNFTAGDSPLLSCDL